MVDGPLQERDSLPVACVRGVANYERVALGALRGKCKKATARSHIYQATDLLIFFPVIASRSFAVFR